MINKFKIIQYIQSIYSIYTVECTYTYRCIFHKNLFDLLKYKVYIYIYILVCILLYILYVYTSYGVYVYSQYVHTIYIHIQYIFINFERTNQRKNIFLSIFFFSNVKQRIIALIQFFFAACKVSMKVLKRKKRTNKERKKIFF